MAKKNNFWEENKVTLIPLLCCAGFLAVLAGIYFGNRKYTDVQYERKRAKEAQSIIDTANQVKDTVAIPAINQKQK